MTIAPTVGRIVWFFPRGWKPPEQPFAAIVCHVHSDTSVNVAVFTTSAISLPALDVLLVQPGGRIPDGVAYCQWMPYQVAMAVEATRDFPP